MNLKALDEKTPKYIVNRRVEMIKSATLMHLAQKN